MAAENLDLGPETLFLASEVARLASSTATPEQRAALLLALAVLAAEREGSTRLPLGSGTLDALLENLGAEPREVEAALARAAAPPGSAWIGRPGDYRPLIADGESLSSQRLRALEERVGRALRGRLGDRQERPAGETSKTLEELRQRPPILPNGKPILLSTEQERAVRAVLEWPLTVVTGGPGTGKTSVVVSILRAVGRREGWDPRRVALAAPTGRAADRLRGALLGFLGSIRDPSGADRELQDSPPSASTLHRLLGFSPRSGRFRHHENNPLFQDLVLVDEASMMDLAMVDRLLRSLRPGARLVLLGDAEQLPSVAAGAIFRDLCRTAISRFPGAAVTLTKSYRMDAGDPAGRAILEAAGRIRSGEPLRPGTDLEAREAPSDVHLAGVELLGGGIRRRIEWWERWAEAIEPAADLAGRVFRRDADGEWLPADRQALEELLRTFESARILTAHRGHAGGTGAEAVNRWFHERHRRRLRLAGRAADPLPGEPVLVTRNDYRRGLFNGDQGVVVRLATAEGEPHAQAVFRVEGDLRACPVESLRGGLELAWATTVHKAQGSEMDRVTVVLPDEPSRILTRELLYTAVTRARRSVLILGSPEILRMAVTRSVERHTGLAELLGGGGPEERETPAAAVPGDQLELPF